MYRADSSPPPPVRYPANDDVSRIVSINLAAHCLPYNSPPIVTIDDDTPVAAPLPRDTTQSFVPRPRTGSNMRDEQK